MVSPQVPLVLHLLLADLAGELPADGVHVEDVLLQVELVAEHPLAVLTHPRLPALPGGTQEGSHLENGMYLFSLEILNVMLRCRSVQKKICLSP